MEEIYKDIIGYEGLYQVSNKGNIKSLNYNKTKKEKVLQPLNKEGYYRISLHKNAKAKWYNIHRLVAIAFIPNFENKPEINHINGIRNDNNITNLEWCTRSENTLHSFRVLKNPPNKTMLGMKSILCPNSIKVLQLTLDNKEVKVWNSITEASINIEINHRNISACCLGKRPTAGKYKWKYLKGE